MSFSDFKNRSKNSLKNLTEKLDEMNKKESYKDDRFWRPELDKSSNGYAVIRFLDVTEGEAIDTKSPTSFTLLSVLIVVLDSEVTKRSEKLRSASCSCSTCFWS